MSTRPILLFLALLGLILGLIIPLEGQSAERCDSCTTALHLLGACESGDEPIDCQPCPAACVAGMSTASDAGQLFLPGSVAFRDEPAAQFASLNLKPSHAPPRPLTFG